MTLLARQMNAKAMQTSNCVAGRVTRAERFRTQLLRRENPCSGDIVLSTRYVKGTKILLTGGTTSGGLEDVYKTWGEIATRELLSAARFFTYLPCKWRK